MLGFSIGWCILMVSAFVVIYMYIMKPSDESFRVYLEEYLRKDIRKDAPYEFDDQTIQIMAKLCIIIMRYEIRDYIVLKLAYITDVNESPCFIGVYRQWYKLLT